MISAKDWHGRINAEFQAHNMTPHYRGVLIALLTFQGSDGRINPSHETLAARTVELGLARDCCAATARRALKHARTLGLLFWLPQYHRVGWRKLRLPNLYILNVPADAVKPGRGPVWPRHSTNRQAVQLQRAIEKKEAASVDRIGALAALAARRRVVEGLLLTGRHRLGPS
jgi:hypothetical protein